MRVLVSGGAGYIGSHMCKMLVEHGHAVAVVDNLSTGHREAVRWGELFVGDIGDSQFLGAVFRRVQPEGVVHFAAKSIVSESVADPVLYYRNNVCATLTLLDEVRKIPGCGFVFSSTAAIFGVSQAVLIDESHPTAPINPYGQSKLTVERVLADYWAAYGLSSVSFRYFNAAGADASGEIGEAHEPETHLIPRILEAMLGRSEQVKVFGDDYDTPDGTCIRDYIHVSDLCAAHLAGLDYLRTHQGAHRFNLGNGAGFSVKEVLSAAEAVIGSPIKYDVIARRIGDPARLVADSTAARQILGWEPQVKELMGIVSSAWRWHQAKFF